MHLNQNPRPKEGASVSEALELVSAPSFGFLLLFQPLLQCRMHQLVEPLP